MGSTEHINTPIIISGYSNENSCPSIKNPNAATENTLHALIFNFMLSKWPELHG